MHFLGKAAWSVKNVKGAIDVALKTRFPLKVPGGTRLNVKRGFRLTISPRIHFYGMVGGEEKLNLLRSSAGLVLPVRWHEPFGLALIESMYFGAPVFATPYGALPELVDARSGVLAASAQELAYAVEHFRPNRTYVHEKTLELFDARRMAREYLLLYNLILDGQQLNAHEPMMLESATDLEWV